MKPAKLPGVEKFKFWDKSLLEEDDDEDDDSISSINDNDSVDSGVDGGGSRPKVKKLTSKSVTSSPGGGSGDSIDGLGQGDSDQSVFIRGYLIRNTCSSLPTSKKSIICDLIDSESESSEQHHSLPVYHTCRPSSCHLVHHHHHHHSHHHYHHRRKVILPISSRLAAKVLTSTDLPLDLFDIRDHYKSTRLREVVVGVTTATSKSNLIAGGGVDAGDSLGGGDGSDDNGLASAGRTTLQPKRYINLNNNNNNNNKIFIHKDTDDNCG